MATKEQVQEPLEASPVPTLVESFRDKFGDFEDCFARLKSGFGIWSDWKSEQEWEKIDRELDREIQSAEE
jgi:hypothetical protein